MGNVTKAIDDVLTHHGTKGMKWGVRNKASQAKASLRRKTGRAGPQDVTVKPTLSRKGIKTKGGEGHPAHPDAVRARTIGQVGKKSGLASLSNKDLQEYTQRLNLEANANRLHYGEKSGPVKFVKRVLGQSGEQAITDQANKAASHQVKKHLSKRLAKIGAVAAVA
jgi:hypothetical protein